MLDERWRIGLASAAGLLTGVRALWAEPPPTVPYGWFSGHPVSHGDCLLLWAVRLAALCQRTQ
jgi:hypothetical protein